MDQNRHYAEDLFQNNLHTKLVTTHLPLLIDDGNGVLQLHIVEETGKEDVGDADQTVVFLLIKKGVCSTEI